MCEYAKNRRRRAATKHVDVIGTGNVTDMQNEQTCARFP